MKNLVLAIVFLSVTAAQASCQTQGRLEGIWYSSSLKPYIYITFSSKDSIFRLDTYPEGWEEYKYYIKDSFLILLNGEPKTKILRISRDSLVIANLLNNSDTLHFTRRKPE